MLLLVKAGPHFQLVYTCCPLSLQNESDQERIVILQIRELKEFYCTTDENNCYEHFQYQ